MRRLKTWTMIPILCLTVVLSIMLSNLISALWPNAKPDVIESEAVSGTMPKSEEPEVITYTETNLGQYQLTAYCPCEKCCGKFAMNRPTDKDGVEIVYTADGSIAREGYTIAADTKVLPFGTMVAINGHVYQVQDRGGAIKGKHIDIYFTSHQAALDFGVQYADVILI